MKFYPQKRVAENVLVSNVGHRESEGGLKRAKRDTVQASLKGDVSSRWNGGWGLGGGV